MSRTALPTVAHVKDHFLPRSETFVFNLIRALRRYRGIVLDRHPRQNADWFPLEPHFSPAERFGPWAGVLERASLRLLRYSPYLERCLRAENARLLHAHFGQLGALFLPVARRRRLPLITSFYGLDASVFAVHPAWRERFDRLWKQGDLFLVLGPKMAERLQSLGCPAEKIRELPIPIDMSHSKFVERVPPPAGEPVRILSAGRLVPKKGMDVLLRALAELKSRYPLRVWVVGEGPERSKLEALRRSLGLEQVVEFLGWVSPRRLQELMAEAHLFVLASRVDPESADMEGTPAVLLEAQAAGLPVASTLHGDIPSIVVDGKTGMLVPEADPAALARGLDSLLSRPDAWAAMGRAGRDFVEERHGSERVGAQLERLYDECLQHGGNGA